MGKGIGIASASVLSCVESARQNIVSFIGLFCKRDLSFYWDSKCKCFELCGKRKCTRSLLQNIVSFIGLFCRRDLSFCVASAGVSSVIASVASAGVLRSANA